MRNVLHAREARPASAAWNVAKTLLQTVVFWGFFLVLLPAAVYYVETVLGGDIFRFAGEATRTLGILLFVIAGTIGLWSGFLMAVHGRGTPLPLDHARRLVVIGPYRYVRNPMAITGISQGIGVGLMLGSPAVVAYALAGAPFWNWLVRPWEEKNLEQHFGAEFCAYRAAVRCWLPRLSPYSIND